MQLIIKYSVANENMQLIITTATEEKKEKNNSDY
jgi:hypothetical protein